MSEMRELIDTELDAVCGGHHGHHGHQGHQGHFDNFGNIVIQENIVEQVGVAIGGNNASVTNLLGSQTNSSSIALGSQPNSGSIASDPLSRLAALRAGWCRPA